MKKKRGDTSGPAKILTEELLGLRHELRETIRAYSARLEIALAKSVSKIRSYAEADKLSRDRISEIRDLTIVLRKRKLKPEKGRRKDLRKIDSLIGEVYEATHPGSSDK